MKYKIFFQEDGALKSKVVLSKDEIPLNVISIENITDKNYYISFRDTGEDIVLLFYEMSMMLESKLPIKDIIEVLLKSHKNGFKKDILETINTSLSDGQPIYKSLEVHKKTLGYLPILFFKLGEQNGNIRDSLSSLYELLKENQKLKENIKKSLRYPMILIASLIMSMSIIFAFVVPKFEHIFLQFGSNLPLSTTILLSIKDTIGEHYIKLIISILGIVGFFVYLIYRFRYFFHKILFFHIPYFSKMYQYMTFYKLFLSIFLIMKSKNKFQDALIYTKDMTSNIFIEEQIRLIIQDINDGKSISDAFVNRSLFDEITTRLLIVGEATNRLEHILEDLQNINKKQLEKYTDNFVAFLTPFFVVLIAGVVLWLVLAIMTPIWELGNFIK